jgi:thiamine-monophosphate kinase
LFVSTDPQKVSEFGEDGLMARIAQRIGPPARDEIWSGDDSAVVRSPGPRTLFTTDLMVEHVDFDLAYASGYDVGWKVIAVNVSDIAAMGGRPGRAVATLTLRPDAMVSFVDALLDGMLAAAEEWGTALVGGDISRGSELSVGVALIGEVTDPVTRSGAQPGNAICVTGSLGGAAGGLIALRRRMAGPGPTEGHGFSVDLKGALERLAARQLRPRARLEEGTALARAGATSMIDLSDGLAVDLARVVEASGVGCRVEPGDVPVDEDLAALASAVTDESIDPVVLALTGGEDFELLCTLPRERIEDATATLGELGTSLSVIGWITDEGRSIGNAELDRWRERGWDHLRGR